jgi:hypothetical protein
VVDSEVGRGSRFVLEFPTEVSSSTPESFVEETQHGGAASD